MPGASPDRPCLQSIARLSEQLTTGGCSVGDVVRCCRERIEAREPEVLAWQSLDWEAVDAQVRILERSEPSAAPLRGVPIGVKDLYDTSDFPTGYGTELYARHQPPWDAAVVARLRAAGAIVIGKTVTTELAYWRPGATRNPLNPAHTPGGSSSGSAAAVADGMVPAALGSQTAASVVRPAAYCGIVGFKPTYGIVSLAGVKAFAKSLDTAGVLARTVADAALVAASMAARPDWTLAEAKVRTAPRITVVRGPEWERVSPDALAGFDRAIDMLRSAGAEVTFRSAPAPFAGLAEAQAVIMAVEAARDYAFERLFFADRLSTQLQELLSEGERISLDQYEEALGQRASALAKLDELFEDATAVAAPSAPGEAPRFEDGTGDPVMSRAWTLLGLPSITIPSGTGPAGLPLGIQLAARPRRDRDLLQAAAWAEAVVSLSLERLS